MRFYSEREVQMEGTIKIVRLVVTIMMALLLSNASEGAASESPDESQQLFFSQFRYAIEAHDINQLIRLTHQNSLQCVAEEDRDYYYGRVLDRLVHIIGKRQIVENIRVKDFVPGELDITPVNPLGHQIKWPVEPQVQLIFKYAQPEIQAVASLFLARDANEWKWIHVCIQ